MNESPYSEKSIFLKKGSEIVGLHAYGIEGPYPITFTAIDGTTTERILDFLEEELWGNFYDTSFKMIGGSFRVFDFSIEDTAKEMEQNGWIRFERKS